MNIKPCTYQDHSENEHSCKAQCANKAFEFWWDTHAYIVQVGYARVVLACQLHVQQINFALHSGGQFHQFINAQHVRVKEQQCIA